MKHNDSVSNELIRIKLPLLKDDKDVVLSVVIRVSLILQNEFENWF